MYLLATTDQIDQQSTKPFLDTCWKRFDDHSCVPTAATYSNPGQAAAPAITAGHHNTWSLVPTAAVAPAAHGWPASGLNSGGYYDLASMYQHQVTLKKKINFHWWLKKPDCRKSWVWRRILLSFKRNYALPNRFPLWVRVRRWGEQQITAQLPLKLRRSWPQQQRRLLHVIRAPR